MSRRSPDDLSLARWKDRLRLAGVPLMAGAGAALGLKWPDLGRSLGRESLIAQARALRRRATHAQPAETPLDVVFLTMMGGHTAEVTTEATIALALEARGHRVRFIVCDRMLPVCENKQPGQEADWDRLCEKCWSFGRSFLNAMGFEVILLSELANGISSGTDAFPDLVEAALLKHYRVGVLDGGSDIEARRDLFERSASISEAAGHRLVAMRPDRVIMSHGIYCTWGPACRLLVDAGIPTVIYNPGKRRDTRVFNWMKAGTWDVFEEWQRVRDVPLSPAQDQAITRYLDSRRTHSQDAIRYNLGEEEDLVRTRDRLRLDPGRQTFALYTNMLWDAASTKREVAFSNPIDWVLSTIEWFGRHPEKQLVIKIHPAEVVVGTKQPFASLIRGQYPELPDNVRLIEPHEKVNSWSIYPVADLGLVHTSTVGLEMALIGVPCAVVSRTHYRGCGFTIDVSSRDSYFELLENWTPDQVDREEISTLARRYAYLAFERYQFPFDALHQVRHGDIRAFNFVDVDDMMSRQSTELLVRCIESREPFLLPR